MDVSNYIKPYVIKDDPIPYKNFLIYPILFKDVFDFLKCYEILNIEKDKISDVRVIKMKYLEFLFKVVFSEEMHQKETTVFLDSLVDLFKLCLKIDLNTSIIKEDSEYGFYLELENGDKITCKDFDVIKKIILYQNFYDYDDTPMTDDFKKAIEEYYSLKNKDVIYPDLELKKDIILTNSGLSVENINNLTYRRFERVFKIIVDKNDFLLNGMLAPHGVNNGKIDHWVYRNKKVKYADAFTSVESVKSKVEGGN